MLRKTAIFLLLLVVCSVVGQTTTASVTVYNEFRPATIHLTTGKLLRVSLANIFLKNSSLLYVSGTQTKQANIHTLTRVDFPDRVYYRLDTLLAYRIDSIGDDGLYCAQQIDIETWKQMVANNTEFTSIDFGDMVGYSTAELSDYHDLRFPVVNLYFYKIDGKIIKVHERKLKQILNKEQRRKMETVIARKGFSWTDENWLKELFKTIEK